MDHSFEFLPKIRDFSFEGRTSSGSIRALFQDHVPDFDYLQQYLSIPKGVNKNPCLAINQVCYILIEKIKKGEIKHWAEIFKEILPQRFGIC